MGTVAAPRGMLGHWIKIKDGKIENYQCVVPTTWNGSPRDVKGQIGAFEASLMNTPRALTMNSSNACLAKARKPSASRSSTRTFPRPA